MLQGPPLVLAGNATTSQVAAFAVPNLVLQQLVALATATSLGFFPFVSAVSATQDRAHLSDVYRANLRITLLLMAPIAAYLAIYGFPLLATWINRGFADEAIGPLRYLAVAGVALALSGAPADVARGLGRPGWVVGFTAGAGGLALGGSFAAVSRYGATGVAGALCGALVCATITFAFLVARRLLALPAATLLQALMRPLVAVTGCVALFALGHVAWSGFAGAVVAGPLALLAYLTATVALVLDDRERAALGRVVPAPLRARWQTQS
jgi:O-antigen/teichoic acid export membrane protein